MVQGMTRGRRSLIAVLQRTTEREVGARCAVTKQAVSAWVCGVKTPGDPARLRLEAAYGIAAGAWDASPDHRGR